MNVLIIEDEAPAASRMAQLVRRVMPQAFIHGPVETVVQAVEWFQNHPVPDLIFMDIHLADGYSFEIFDNIKLSVPVIFTTAYDQYAIKAFKVNSIDYLLKPISQEELQVAVNKFLAQKEDKHRLTTNYENLRLDLGTPYKSRFLIRVGERLQTVETSDIMLAFIWEKGTWLLSADGKRHLIDYSLEQLQSLLNPDEFFRLNRQYLTRYEAIDKITTYGNGRLNVTLHSLPEEKIILSRERTKDFKNWIDR